MNIGRGIVTQVRRFLSPAYRQARLQVTGRPTTQRAKGPAARRRDQIRSAQSGFALLETLIAFVIAAIALAVLYQAELSGLRSTQAAQHYEMAVARARSHMTLAEHASPLIAGDWRGDDGGGFAWHLRVTSIASTTVQPVTALTLTGSASFPLTLYAVTVWITWADNGATREVRLDTEHIGQDPK